MKSHPHSMPLNTLTIYMLSVKQKRRNLISSFQKKKKSSEKTKVYMSRPLYSEIPFPLLSFLRVSQISIWHCSTLAWRTWLDISFRAGLRWQIPLAFVYFKMSLFQLHFWRKFTAYRILAWHVIFFFYILKCQPNVFWLALLLMRNTILILLLAFFFPSLCDVFIFSYCFLRFFFLSLFLSNLTMVLIVL